MKKNWVNKHFSIGLAALLGVMLLCASSGVAMAAASGGGTGSPNVIVPDFISCAITGSIGTCLVYIVTFSISNTIGLFISLGAWLAGLAMQFSQNIYNSPLVQAGFGVTLAIANLGFVLALIIMAMATILRREGYGIKKILAKLIIMAILVNFGLVLTAPIVGFADSMTTYFTNQISGQAGFQGTINAMVNEWKASSISQVPTPNTSAWCSTALNAASYANPATLFIPSSWLKSFCNTVTRQKNNQTPAETFSQALLSMVLTIVLQFIIALAFLSLAVLFLIRYVYLGLLLVVLPFAWLAWIFPKSASQFSRWWNNFIKWAFFGPAALFFIWLTLKINSAPYFQQVINTQANAQSSASSPLSTIVTDTLAGVVPLSAIGGDFILMGILIGGLMMASHLTGKAGSFVVDHAKSVSNGVAGYVGKKGKRVASKAVPTQVKERLERGGYRWMPNRLQVATGIGLGKMKRAGSTDLVSQQSEWAKELIKEDPEAAKRIVGQKFGIRGGVNSEKGMALVAALHETGKLQDLISEGRNIGGKSAEEFLKDKALFEGYGQQKLRKDAQEKVLLTDEVIQAKEQQRATTPGSPAFIAATKNLTDVMEALLKKTKNVTGAAEYMKSDPELAEMHKKLTDTGTSIADAAKAVAQYIQSRGAISLAAGKAFSAQAYSSFLSKFERSDQLDEYLAREKAVIDAEVRANGLAGAAATALREKFFNSQVVNWIKNSPGARNLGVDENKIGLT